MGSEEELKAVGAEVATCQRCRLHASRKRSVPGEGPVDAEVVFIGEGPGFHENEQGRPFVGAAGHFLDELLAGVGLQRDQVFICNVIKCRPPGNRDPQADELEACSEYLDRQLRIINPKVIVTLGRFSMARYFPNARISAVHGKLLQWQGHLVLPLYHPAAALHQPTLRSAVEADFAHLPEAIAKARQAPTSFEEPPEAPQQLSLF